jgi:hypothetical protein
MIEANHVKHSVSILRPVSTSRGIVDNGFVILLSTDLTTAMLSDPPYI